MANHIMMVFHLANYLRKAALPRTDRALRPQQPASAHGQQYFLAMASEENISGPLFHAWRAGLLARQFLQLLQQ
jgi:hypothetical protein